MGRWLIRREDGRYEVSLHHLPRWAALAIAAAVVGAVVAAARTVDPDPALPAWLPAAIRVGGWIYLCLVLLLAVRWLSSRWPFPRKGEPGGTPGRTARQAARERRP